MIPIFFYCCLRIIALLSHREMCHKKDKLGTSLCHKVLYIDISSLKYLKIFLYCETQERKFNDLILKNVFNEYEKLVLLYFV